MTYHKNNKESDEKKVASPYSITESPENYLFVLGIMLCWLLYHRDAMLTWKSPTIFMTYWFIVFILIIVLILALWFYTKILADVFSNPQNFSKETVIKTIKETLKWGLIMYVYAYLGNVSAEILIKLVKFLFFYHIVEKIYYRIFKKIDFIAESAQQRYRTRLNNRLLLFFPLWYLVITFVPDTASYLISTVYLVTFLAWYNRWPIDTGDEYTVTKAQAGSEERIELIKEAMEAVEAEAMEIGDELEELLDEDDEFGEETWLVGYQEENEELDYEEEIRLELTNERNTQMYFKDKLYPIHEYYLWWLMKDVPFYFTVKSFYYMLMDIIFFILRICFLFPTYSVVFLVTALPISLPLLNQAFWMYTIFSLASHIPILWLGNNNVNIYYSWNAFFYRDESYLRYDDVHPYAIIGPTVDGPHNWQYWFFVLFSFFPSRRSIISQEQLFDEELRLAEIALEFPSDLMDFTTDDDFYTMHADIWNPIDLYLLRKAAPGFVKKFKDKLRNQEQFRDIDQELFDDWKWSIPPQPQWWRHYYI